MYQLTSNPKFGNSRNKRKIIPRTKASRKVFVFVYSWSPNCMCIALWESSMWSQEGAPSLFCSIYGHSRQQRRDTHMLQWSHTVSWPFPACQVVTVPLHVATWSASFYSYTILRHEKSPALHKMFHLIFRYNVLITGIHPHTPKFLCARRDMMLLNIMAAHFYETLLTWFAKILFLVKSNSHPIMHFVLSSSHYSMLWSDIFSFLSKYNVMKVCNERMFFALYRGFMDTPKAFSKWSN